MSKPTLLDMYRRALAPLACPSDLNMEPLTKCDLKKCTECWDKAVEERYVKYPESKGHK